MLNSRLLRGKLLKVLTAVLAALYTLGSCKDYVLADAVYPLSDKLNTFGERCLDEACVFDKSSVGNDVSRYCITKVAGGGRPVQLVKPTANRLGLELVDEGINLLRTLRKPLAIVAAIGSIKTGKSFFMNLLNEHMFCGNGKAVEGFEASNSATPTTRGIWMWSKPIEVNCESLKEWLENGTSYDGMFAQFITAVDSILGGTLKATVLAQAEVDISECIYEKVNLVLLDVEGFHATDGFQRYDEALFTIASTLSTELVYFANRLVNARDAMELQHMLQMANASLFNMQKALSNAPHVVIHESEEGSYTLSVPQANELKESDDFGKLPRETAKTGSEDQWSLHRNANLTVVVQDFNLHLQKSAISYITEVLNGKRYDLSYEENRSFIKYMESMSNKFLNLFRDQSVHSDGHGFRNNFITDLLSRITSGYKYGIPHLFDSLDVVLASNAFNGDYQGSQKANLVAGYLQQILRYKLRLFKRSLLRPKQRYSPVMDKPALMNGDDMVDLLTHLVDSLNRAIRSGIADNYMGDMRVTRANLVKRDLVDLYANELSGFIQQIPIPLENELQNFNRQLENKYINQLTLHARFDVSAEQFENIRSSFKKLSEKTMQHFETALYDITATYCQSKVPVVKGMIREKISELKFPVLPSVIRNLEDNKKEFLDLYTEAVDESMTKYSNSAACKDVYKDVERYINGVLVDLQKENEEEVSLLFRDAVKRSLESFNTLSDRNSVELYKVTQKEFVENLNEWMNHAYGVFYEVIGQFKSMENYMQQSLVYLRKEMKQAEMEVLEHWTDVCKESAMQVYQKFVNTFDSELDKLVPHRPAPKAVLLLAMDYMRIRGIFALEDVYCKGSQIVREAQVSISRIVDEKTQKHLADNYEAIFKRFDQDFKVLEQEAFKQVDKLYLFYQLKKHIHLYAKLNVFNKIALLDKEFSPKKNIDALVKNVNFDLVNSLPAEYRICKDLQDLQTSGEANAARLVGLELQTLSEDIVEQWLETKLYPVIRSRLMLRMPTLSTCLAIAGVIVSSLLMVTIRESRTLCFLYFLSMASIVKIMGPKKIMSFLKMSANFLWQLLKAGVNTLGPLWTYVICVSIVAFVAMWYLFLYRVPALLRPRESTGKQK